MCKKNAKDKKYEPIIFLNAPIKEEDKDAIGISSSVEMIKSAINNDAKMIGVIAEYGAGKSSLTGMLAKPKDYTRVVRINMWDSINAEENKGQEISNLTKSYIYQLASGISKKAASYVNKILNNNYGIISFSVGYKKTWLFFALAVLCFALYLVGDNITIKHFVQIFGENSRTLGMGLKWLAPVSCIMGIALAALGIYFSSFVFSSWKESHKRQTGINEVFTAYSYVFDLLLGWFKPTLVLIDDLDRIEEKESIVGFLRELYRFNSLCSHKWKKAPIFIISIAPEAYLKNEKESTVVVCRDGHNQCDEIESNEKWVYSKIFDYIISLKPIHYDDYRNVISQIIENEPENKKRLNEVLPDGEKIDDKNLPEAFKWLYRGENLTLRELKARLNQAIALLIDLKNKNYDGSPFISFKTCVCVTYLERTYPEEFYKLLKKEREFSEIIQTSYIWRNVEEENSADVIKEHLNKKLGSWDINGDIATLICEGIIDTDYRMYFYSFPKSSYIKDLDEKDICNYLEFPKDYPYEKSQLDEKIQRICEKEKLSTVYAVIKRISKTKEILYFSEVVFENKILWLKACECNLEKMVSSYNHILNWEQKSYEACCAVLKTLAGFELEKENAFWKSYIEKLCDESFLLKDESIVKMRKALISEFPERILELSNLFLDQHVPIISEEEVVMIGNASKTVLLVHKDKIDKNNYQYIQSLVLATQLEEGVLSKAMSIQKTMIEKLPFEDLLLGIYNFMYANHITDDNIFSLLCDEVERGTLEESKVCDYVNELPLNSLTESYLKDINRLCVFGGLREGILLCLIEGKLYISWLLNIGCAEEIGDVDVFAQDEIPSVLDACEIINKKYPEFIPKIRAELVRLNNGEIYPGYETLYVDQYRMITISELSEIKSFVDGIDVIDASKFTKENIGSYVNFINSAIHSGQECFYIFDSLFNPKYSYVCTDAEIVSLFLEQLDFSRIIFDTMSEEDKNSVVEIMRKPLGLANLDSAKNFMKTVKCLIYEFEVKMVQTLRLDAYISFVNEVNLVSDYTIEMLLNHPAKYKLNSAITKKLLEVAAYEHYIIGKTLYDGKLEFPMEGIPDETILSLYKDNSLIKGYFIVNQEFMETVMKNRLYRKFSKPCTKGMLEPFMKMKQTADFLKFVLDTLSENEVKVYLKSLNEIADENNSVAISRLLTTDKYINYLVDKETYKHVEFRLWDNVKEKRGHKAAFTRKRNAYISK